jgi:hypothetical protein
MFGAFGETTRILIEKYPTQANKTTEDKSPTFQTIKSDVFSICQLSWRPPKPLADPQYHLFPESARPLSRPLPASSAVSYAMSQNRASPTFPTGPLSLEFCRKNLNRFKGRWGENACSEDLPSFRRLVSA